VRIRAGSIVVEPWLNPRECIECLESRGSIQQVLLEPIVAYSSLYRKAEPIIKNMLLAIGHRSYIIMNESDAIECGCLYIKVEKDAWGEAEEYTKTRNGEQKIEMA